MIELIKTVILLAAAVYVAYIVSSNPVEKRVKIARIIPDAKLPTRATDGSSGYDLDQEPALRVSECFPAEITFTKRGNGGFGSTGVK